MPNYFDHVHSGSERFIAAIDFSAEAKIADNVRELSRDPLRVALVEQNWHFGVVLPLSLPAVAPEEMLIIEIEANVSHGNVRAGCVDAEMANYVSDEKDLFPSPDVQCVKVEVPADAAYFVLRTGILENHSARPELEVVSARMYAAVAPAPISVVDVEPAPLPPVGVPGIIDSTLTLTVDLLMTHSTRPFDSTRASVEFIARRYADKTRFANAPPFESFSSSSTQNFLHGAITHCRLAIADGVIQLETIRCIDAKELVEQASTVSGRFVISCNGFLCALPSVSTALSGLEFAIGSPYRIDDPWFSGVHSAVGTGEQDECVVSASGPDAVLWVDLKKKLVTRRFRLPESLYGLNYPLTPEMSVHDHYIPNDFQLGHLNSAYPDDAGGCYITTLGQGDVGHFDRAGRYELLATGYVGAHGVRQSNITGSIYFTQSPLGTINQLQADGSVNVIANIDTAWLHDAQEIAPDLFLCMLVDRNELMLFDVRSRSEVARFDVSKRGFNPQFLSLI